MSLGYHSSGMWLQRSNRGCRSIGKGACSISSIYAVKCRFYAASRKIQELAGQLIGLQVVINTCVHGFLEFDDVLYSRRF